MEVANRNVSIIKKADDPECTTRVSIGGDPDLGYYCTYRGTKEAALEAIKMAYIALHGMAARLQRDGIDEPDISPNDGKQYA